MIRIIGIIGALDKEVTFLCEKLEKIKTMKKAYLTFHQGILKGKEVVVVKSGVGKVNAALCTQILIDYFKTDSIFCTGVAGALREELDIGDVVISTDVAQHDVDGTVFGHEPGEIPNLGVKFFKADENLVEIAWEVACRTLKGKKAVKGRILTGDQFISSADRVRYLREYFDGSCVEMEGGAIGHVCYVNDVPFVVIRSISDRADDKAVVVYEEFSEVAAKNSSNIILGILDNLK
ncbi:5'-methylthioadenosine/adenosylhomocysteine nucleosidase [Thermovorax subterraneus]|jgi:adenosylhomocysteine nucleosidase|nr:5'-methylthioadenosine/adenosylhomocysteine nucleosidase [Thermovorax subterraneus]